MLKKTTALLLLTSTALLPACGKEEKTEGAASADASATEAPKKPAKAAMNVKAKLGGKDVTFKHAIVADRGTSAVWIHLSEKPLDCEKMNTGFVKSDDGVGAAIQLANQLQPDGKLKWVVKSAKYVSGKKRESKFDRKKAKVNKVDGKVDGEMRADVEFKIEPKEGDAMEVKGLIVAKGCGTKASSSKKADPRPQKGLKVSISGHTFDIQGALLKEKKDGDVVLSLTTAPAKCGGYTPAGDFGIDLRLDKKDKKSIAHVWYRGDMMASNYNTSRSSGSLAVGAEKDGKVDVDVTYEETSFDFKVSVKGKADALKCTEKK